MQCCGPTAVFARVQIQRSPTAEGLPLWPADVSLPPPATITSPQRAPPFCQFSWWLSLSVYRRCWSVQMWACGGPAGRLFEHQFVPSQSLGSNPERWFIIGKFGCEKPLISHSECVACWHALSAWIIIPIHVRASAGGIHLLLSNSQSSQHASLWSKFSSPLLWSAFETGEIIPWLDLMCIIVLYSVYLHNQRQLDIFIDNLLFFTSLVNIYASFQS